MSETMNLSKSIKKVYSISGQAIDIPGYCRKRISFFRYNKECESLEIVCSKCKKSFPVLKISKEDGPIMRWDDIHNEDQYHFMSEISGYAAECVSCKNELVQTQSKIDKPVTKVEEKVAYTVFLTQENKKYLQLYKIIYNEEITEVINRAIDDLRSKKPIEIKTSR